MVRCDGGRRPNVVTGAGPGRLLHRDAATAAGDEGVIVEVETIAAGDAPARPGRRWIKPAAVVVAGALSLWLLRSSLGAVYGDLASIAGVDARWLVAILACESIAFVASWQLNRVALRTDGWFDVAVAQLTGNAVSNVVPAGSAAGAAMQLRVLSLAGFEMTRAATSLGALTILGLAGLLAIPALALPSPSPSARTTRVWRAPCGSGWRSSSPA